eukprot:jgi/Astpho2/2170/Aster-x0096
MVVNLPSLTVATAAGQQLAYLADPSHGRQHVFESAWQDAVTALAEQQQQQQQGTSQPAEGAVQSLEQMLQQQLAHTRAREQHRAMEELLYVAAVADVTAASLSFISSGDMRIQQDKLTAFMSPAAADAVEAELQSALGSHFAGQDETILVGLCDRTEAAQLLLGDFEYGSYFLAALENMCKEADMPLQGNSDALLEMASKLPKSVVK